MKLRKANISRVTGDLIRIQWIHVLLFKLLWRRTDGLGGVIKLESIWVPKSYRDRNNNIGMNNDAIFCQFDHLSESAPRTWLRLRVPCVKSANEN